MSGSEQSLPTNRRLAGGTAVLFAVRIAGLVMGLVVSVLLARGLGVEALGTFSTGLALVHIGVMLTDVGLSALLIREGAAAPTLRQAMLQWATRARVVAGLLMSLLLVGAALLTVEGTEARLTVAVIIAAVPLTALTLGMTLLQQQLMLARMAQLLLAQSMMWLAIVAILYTLDAGLWAYAIAFVAYNAAYGLLVHRVAKRSLTGLAEPMKMGHFARLMREAVPLSATFVLVTLYYKLDALFVYRFAGAAAAGSYAIAYRFLDQLAIVPVTLGNIFFPLLNRGRNRGAATQPLFDRYVRMTLLVTVPVVAIGMLLARPLISLFGAEYVDAVVLLRLLLPAFLIVALSYVVVHVAIAHHQSKKQLFCACIGLVINVALNLIFIPRYGARAAAVVTVLTEAGVVGCLYAAIRRPCGLRLPWQWLLRLAAVVVLSGAASALARDNPYVAGVVFAVAYLVGVTALAVVDLGEIRSLLRRQPPSEPPVGSADAVQQESDLGPEVINTQR